MPPEGGVFWVGSTEAASVELILLTEGSKYTLIESMMGLEGSTDRQSLGCFEDVEQEAVEQRATKRNLSLVGFKKIIPQ